MEYKYLELTIEDHVATVSLNRTKKYNAVNNRMAEEIAQMFQAIDKDNDIWVVIFKSNAPIFCAGIDLSDSTLASNRDAATMLKLQEDEKLLFDSCNAIDDCRKPVIAAVNNKCIGFGLDFIACCDMVICTEDASFALREPRIGIVSDIGALQRLPHIIGMANTKRMAYTSAFFSAEQVEKMGLVVEICPDVDSMMSAAQNLADQIKKSAPLAVQCCKEVINYNRYSSIQEGITLAVHKNMILLATEDFKEAITAFIEKRPPAFKGK